MRSTNRLILPSLICFLTATAGVASADAYSQQPTDDTWIGYFSGGDFGNRNGDAGIESQGGLDQVDRQERVLLKWDLSSIPAGSTINSAVVRLRGGALYSIGPNPGLVELRHVVAGNDWSETTATWASRNGVDGWAGGIGAAPAGAPAGLAGSGGGLSATPWDSFAYPAALSNAPIPNLPVNLNVAGLVQQWVDAALPNNGVSLQLGTGLSGTGAPDLYVFITNSADAGSNTDTSTLLIVDYTPVPEPAAVSLIALPLLCISCRKRRVHRVRRA